MSFFDQIADLFTSEARHLVLQVIPKERQEPAVDSTVIQAEKHYVRVWLADMFLKDDRRLFRGFVPVVHSVVRLQFGSKAALELPYVAGPQDIGMGTTLGEGIQVNHALTNLLPFRGGKVSISAGLFAYKAKDFFEGFSKVLHDVTGMLNVGQLSAALKVVDSAVAGVQNLFGAGEKDVHLLYSETFAGATGAGGATLRSGYVAVVKADAQSFDKAKLYVKQSQLCFGKSLAEARPLEGYDYMLLRIEASTERDDFLTFETFAELLKKAIEEGVRDRAAGDAVIKTALLAAWSSPDLTIADRRRVVVALDHIYREALAPIPDVQARPAPALSDVAELLNTRIAAMPSHRIEAIAGRTSNLDAFVASLEDRLG
jgi:hypothetical protein